MRGSGGIIGQTEREKVDAGLETIRKDRESGALRIDPDDEDIHTWVGAELTARIGDAGKRLNTARSRNDQVALDIRMTLKNKADDPTRELRSLATALVDLAPANLETVMPGDTHLQLAHPGTFSHHPISYP